LKVPVIAKKKNSFCMLKLKDEHLYGYAHALPEKYDMSYP